MPLIVPTPARSIQWAASLQPGSYGFSSSKQATGAGSNGQMVLSPVYFHRSVTIDRLGCEVTGAGEAGSVMRPGIYADNGNLYPGALLLDAGTVTGDATGIKEITISLVIPAGVVWVGAAWQSAATTRPTVRCISGSPPLATTANTDVANTNSGFSAGGITGALPATWTSTVGRSGAVPRIFWRIAS